MAQVLERAANSTIKGTLGSVVEPAFVDQRSSIVKILGMGFHNAIAIIGQRAVVF